MTQLMICLSFFGELEKNLERVADEVSEES